MNVNGIHIVALNVINVCSYRPSGKPRYESILMKVGVPRTFEGYLAGKIS
jgi:hypothetical protein